MLFLGENDPKLGIGKICLEESELSIMHFENVPVSLKKHNL